MPFVRWLQRLAHGGRPDRRIEDLTAKAATSSPRYRASLYARAGDMARELGDEGRADALRWYGKSVDGYLEAGRGRAAEVICERIVAAYPDVVRARCTLALIAVGHGDTALARTRIADYVAAVAREHSRDAAVAALLQMAAVTDAPEPRLEIARGLEKLEEPELARRLIEGRAAVASGTSWSRAVAAALRRPDEVDVEALTQES